MQILFTIVNMLFLKGTLFALLSLALSLATSSLSSRSGTLCDCILAVALFSELATLFLFLQPFLMPLSLLYFVLQHSACQPVVLAFRMPLSLLYFVLQHSTCQPVVLTFLMPLSLLYFVLQHSACQPVVVAFLMPLSLLYFVLQHSVCQPVVLVFLTEFSWRHFVLILAVYFIALLYIVAGSLSLRYSLLFPLVSSDRFL